MSPALPVVSGEEVIVTLSLIGYKKVSQRGSHVMLRHPDRGIVIVPLHKELAKGTLKSILSQAGINTEDFVRLLWE